MRIPLIVLLFIIRSNCFGQKINYQNLLDTVLSRHSALFVHSKPLKITRLDPKEMWEYFEYIKESSNQYLDTTMFFQIIQNSKLADTTLWTDKELPKALLVNERDERISNRYALQKLGLTDDKQKASLKKQVTKFNLTETFDRNICYFSRPVFDNSKLFAIVQWDNGHGYLGGGGGIILFRLQSDTTWKEFGIISNWRY